MKNKRVLSVFFEGLKIYCLNIHKFLLYMAFPVLGQVLGLFLIFGLNYWYTQNIKDLSMKYSALNNMSTLIGFAVLVVIPGLLIYMKAFWDYLVAYGALNSMTEGYLNTGKVYDFKSHNEVILNKTFSFIALWFIFGIFTFLAVIPIFWIICGIFFIYFILIFQVFTFENGLSPFGYFRRSFEIIKGNYARTFVLMSILLILTYFLLPSGFSVIFDYLNLTEKLSKCFEAYAFTLPIESLEPYGVTPALIGKSMFGQFVAFIIIGFTLPLRSICWTLWYNNLAEKPVEEQIQKKNSSYKKKRLTGKSFKTEKREIDPEIIRHAQMEDDDY
ncbi:hypothetical protein J6P92_06370 [bacterium]|nr:hypothetical protein [bacterium]